MKEADALTSAGFDVRVVASQHVEWVVNWDVELISGRTWSLDAVRWDGADCGSKSIRISSGARQRLFQTITKAMMLRSKVAELAFCRLYKELLKRACEQSADLYIAHNPQALPVACEAARRKGARAAFDSEDFHTGEFSADEQSSLSFRLLYYLESTYLPQCIYITTPSEAISDALTERYGISRPIALHNVFSWADRCEIDGEIRERRGPELSLYWYSQNIGLDRGIQDMIRASALLSKPVQIHLRGDAKEEVKAELLRLARECSVVDRLYFHPLVHPKELLARTAEHDVGLALEQPVNKNRIMTVTNKLFSYLLAGLAIAATDTEGQRAIMKTCPGAGLLYAPGDYSSLAAGLQRLIDSPELLKRSKEAALSAARERWNWEMESRKLIKLVASALNGKNHQGVNSFAPS